MSGFVTVARLSDLPASALVPVDVNGVKIVLARSGGAVHALHDECSHEEFPLSDGEIEGNQVTCLLHGARFDLETGECLTAVDRLVDDRGHRLRRHGGVVVMHGGAG